MKREPENIKATPRPWAVREWGSPRTVRIVGPDWREELAPIASLSHGYNPLTTEANGRLIVKSVNLHDELVAVVQRFAEAMMRGRYPELQGVACDAFEVLRKAKEDA